MSSWTPGKFKGRGRKADNLKDLLFSGKIKNRNGIITAANRAIGRAARQTKKDIEEWVDIYVPEDTGNLVSSFWLRQPRSFASKDDMLVKYKLKMGLDDEQAPYAEIVNKMKPKHKTKSTSIFPFWGPLQKFAKKTAMQNLVDAFAAEGLKFNAKTMRVEE